MNRSYFHLSTILLCLLFAVSCGQEDTPLFDCYNFSDRWSIKEGIYNRDFLQKDLFFANESIGYSVGFGGSIMKSVDSGETWVDINNRNFVNRITELNLCNVYFLDENIGFISGERKEFGDEDELKQGAILLKTNDGGQNWTKKYFEEIKRFDDIIFFNAQDGVAIVTRDKDSLSLTRNILSTIDAGESWQEVYIPGIKINSFDLHSSNDSLFFLAKDELDKSILVVSQNRGIDWKVFALPEHDCHRIYLVNNFILYLTCGNIFLTPKAYKSEDGGESWLYDGNNPVNNNSVFHAVADSQVIVINSIIEFVSTGGYTQEKVIGVNVFETVNSGKDWSKVEIINSCDFIGPSCSISNSSFGLMSDTFKKFYLE